MILAVVCTSNATCLHEIISNNSHDRIKTYVLWLHTKWRDHDELNARIWHSIYRFSTYLSRTMKKAEQITHYPKKEIIFWLFYFLYILFPIDSHVFMLYGEWIFENQMVRKKKEHTFFINELVKIPTGEIDSCNRKFIFHIDIDEIEPNQNGKKNNSFRFEWNQIKIFVWTNTPAICWISNFDIIARPLTPPRAYRIHDKYCSCSFFY